MQKVYRSTDFGTVILHTMLVASFAVLVASGLRIAADDPDSQWIAVLDPLLPVEHLWLSHLVVGVAFSAIIAAYVCYIRKARLQSRVRFDKARLLVILRPGRPRWAALNVLVYWILMAALLTAMVSGYLLFAGVGQPMIALHRYATFVCIGSVLAHIGLHAAAGGIGQLARIVRPGPLHVAPPPTDLAELLAEQLAKQMSGAGAAPQVQPEAASVAASIDKPVRSRQADTLNAHPLASALAVASVVGGLSFGAEQATRPVLRVAEIAVAEAPSLDGDLSDAVWTKAQPVSIMTTQGGDFGGTHQSLVEIRAVHDGEFAYFAFVWEDPTRSLKHLPLVKRGRSWHVAATREDLGDESKYFEDKFAVLLSAPGLPLIGAAIHLARQPLTGLPPSSSGRGLHYILGGGIADVWQWRASHGGPAGHIDNCHIGRPLPPVGGEPQHYAGGFALDPGAVPYQSNIVELPKTGGGVTILPRQLPRDFAAMAQAMGRIDDVAGVSESEGARWWMTGSETLPYSPALDAGIPDGSVIPSILFTSEIVNTSRTGIRGVARWAAGRWTLEVARRLYTGGQFDMPIKSGMLMWVAAFDHSEKRHTRHLRPVRLEVD